LSDTDCKEGFLVRFPLGARLGLSVLGFLVGKGVSSLLGLFEGETVGLLVTVSGDFDGLVVDGETVGLRAGFKVGVEVAGEILGVAIEGAKLGLADVGSLDGFNVMIVGDFVGLKVGNNRGQCLKYLAITLYKKSGC
jgi:hypothetical protein